MKNKVEQVITRFLAEVLRRPTNNEGVEVHLSWDSWDRQHHPQKVMGLSPKATRTRATRASVPSEDCLTLNNNNRGGAIPPSPSVSSITSLNAQCEIGPPLTPPSQSRGKGMHVHAFFIVRITEVWVPQFNLFTFDLSTGKICKLCVRCYLAFIH